MVATTIGIDRLLPEPRHRKRKEVFDEGKPVTEASVADTTAETTVCSERKYFTRLLTK